MQPQVARPRSATIVQLLLSSLGHHWVITGSSRKLADIRGPILLQLPSVSWHFRGTSSNMSPSREGEAEHASELTYPSPGAEAMDSGPFYHPKTEHQDPTEHHVTEEAQHQEHQQAQMATQQPSSPQHVSRPSNLEELQLAAQLGQGLAGTSIMPATDPSMNVDDPNMRTIMPHPHADPSDQQHPSPYVQEAPSTGSIDQHPMPLPVGPPLPPQYSMGDGVPPRKRSKVSRACDECRRKKIKCDAQSDTGETPCSSCARSSTPCLFSRVPQKRGPSKGYGPTAHSRLE